MCNVVFDVNVNGSSRCGGGIECMDFGKFVIRYNNVRINFTNFLQKKDIGIRKIGDKIVEFFYFIGE